MQKQVNKELMVLLWIIRNFHVCVLCNLVNFNQLVEKDWAVVFIFLKVLGRVAFSLNHETLINTIWKFETHSNVEPSLQGLIQLT